MDEDQAQRFNQAERLRRGYRRSGRRRIIIGFIALLMIFGGIGAFAAYRVNKDKGPDGPEIATSDYGITLEAEDLAPKGKEDEADESDANAVVVQLWDDFSCAECRSFNLEVKTYLRQAVRRGEVKLTYHPFLDAKDKSSNNYAERAANAAACVADEAGAKAYADMHDRLMNRQPKAGKAGASTADLITWAQTFGAEKAKDCIEDRKFVPWLEEAVLVGEKSKVTKAPTVRVDGTEIVSPDESGADAMPDRKELKFAIDEAAK